ncbi:hypothetical protein BaRGS_00000057 [Batillaria attramentaria]|uniref:Uncharacterized protein n=1 Tax=Batillaria attramentaria TaxID=370345 RepID=A0ABD0MB52_9CAEN
MPARALWHWPFSLRLDKFEQAGGRSTPSLKVKLSEDLKCTAGRRHSSLDEQTETIFTLVILLSRRPLSPPSDPRPTSFLLVVAVLEKVSTCGRRL